MASQSVARDPAVSFRRYAFVRERETAEGNNVFLLGGQRLVVLGMGDSDSGRLWGRQMCDGRLVTGAQRAL